MVAADVHYAQSGSKEGKGQPANKGSSTTKGEKGVQTWSAAKGAIGPGPWGFPLTTEQMFDLISTRSDESETTLEDPCIVCMCDIRKGERVLELGCGHAYHVECIEKWLEVRGKCPVCQTKVGA